jgi:hypothetical protein
MNLTPIPYDPYSLFLTPLSVTDARPVQQSLVTPFLVQLFALRVVHLNHFAIAELEYDVTYLNRSATRCSFDLAIPFKRIYQSHCLGLVPSYPAMLDHAKSKIASFCQPTGLSARVIQRRPCVEQEVRQD